VVPDAEAACCVLPKLNAACEVPNAGAVLD
jgi:hypothetical protein